MNRDERLAALIAEHRPFDGARRASDRDHWALITASGDPDGNGVTWLRTFPTRDRLDTHVANDLAGGERLVRLVNLDTGAQATPLLVWVRHQCPWPGCGDVPAKNGRVFLGAKLCARHTDESHGADADAQAEIEEVRRAGLDRC